MTIDALACILDLRKWQMLFPDIPPSCLNDCVDRRSSETAASIIIPKGVSQMLRQVSPNLTGRHGMWIASIMAIAALNAGCSSGADTGHPITSTAALAKGNSSPAENDVAGSCQDMVSIGASASSLVVNARQLPFDAGTAAVISRAGRDYTRIAAEARDEVLKNALEGAATALRIFAQQPVGELTSPELALTTIKALRAPIERCRVLSAESDLSTSGA